MVVIQPWRSSTNCMDGGASEDNEKCAILTHEKPASDVRMTTAEVPRMASTQPVRALTKDIAG
jgi:hypothetical protein